MQQAYFQKIERKWQKFWEENSIFLTQNNEKKKKFYCLAMFPYPSGKIHMGHLRNYSIADSIAIQKRMEGYNVLNPIGWDAFGLPAENAALENNQKPSEWTEKNIQFMKSQLIKLGFSYDWSREIKTCDPLYYHWEQIFFIELFHKGIAYQKEAEVNWCKTCATVLANEQVENNLCWRCHQKIEFKKMKQWFLKITDYAEALLDFSELDQWPKKVLEMQKNWIGKSTGIEILFKWKKHPIPIFTTQAETIYGVTFLALSKNHPLINTILENHPKKKSILLEIDQLKSAKNLDDKKFEKIAIFTNEYATHPLTDEKIPILITNFVVEDYASGALMGVPAHDERDFELAQKFNIPIKQVIINNSHSENLSSSLLEEAFLEDGILINSKEFNGLDRKSASIKISTALKIKNLAKDSTQYRLKDWLISRQRYWGTPIPIVYCTICGIQPLSKKDLPIILPLETKENLPSLSKMEAFYKTKCPKCHNTAYRETDTMDTFISSSWYFIRFLSPDLKNAPFDKKDLDYWKNVDQYVGGIEHAILHLLYARFFTKVLKDLNYISFSEPFLSLLTQGMVLNYSYYSKSEMRYLSVEELDPSNPQIHPVTKETLRISLDKMSKSKKNGIDPNPLLEKYGADALRLFSLFAAPPEKDLEWNSSTLEGSYRFILRLFSLLDIFNQKKILFKNHKNDNQLLYEKPLDLFSLEDYKVLTKDNKHRENSMALLHEKIKMIQNEYSYYRFNTMIAKNMELVKYLQKFQINDFEDLITFKIFLEVILCFMFPIIPHSCEEINFQIQNIEKNVYTSLFSKSFPKYFPTLYQSNDCLYLFQVNGKLRFKKEFPKNSSEASIINSILEEKSMQKWLENKKIKKFIFVPEKLLNIII